LAASVTDEVIILILWSYINHDILSTYDIFINENIGYISDVIFSLKISDIYIIDIYCRYIYRANPAHRAAPGNTGPHQARSESEMTDYFTSTTVTSTIKV